MSVWNKHTNESVTKAAKKVNGDKYDYSLVEYKSMTEKVKIICLQCNEVFLQSMKMHLRGCDGCKKCYLKSRCDTTETFIKKAKMIYDDKYDYSLVNYIKAKEHKVEIICNGCKNHFYREPDVYLAGHGCSLCDKKMSFEEFIEKAKNKHGDKYDYTLVKYIKKHIKITIKHVECGRTFQQRPAYHIRGAECPLCYRRNVKTLEDFIREAQKIHKDHYDYSRVKYVDNETEVNIKCNICDIWFWQKVNNHFISWGGCSKCAKNINLKPAHEYFNEVKQLYGNRYDYTKSIYNGINHPITIKCTYCNKSFTTNALNHLRGCNCKCTGYRTEYKLYLWLIAKGFKVNRQVSFSTLSRYHFDFYISDLDLIIELDGDQHFRQIKHWKDFTITQKNDRIKMRYCIMKDLSMIRLYQPDVLDNRNNWDIKLLEAIKKYDKPTIKFISTTNRYDIYKEFNDENYINELINAE